MTWDHEAWVKAWGWNAPLIVGGINDELFRLPKIPAHYNWMVIRETTGPPKKPEPAYFVSLGEIVRDSTKPDESDWSFHVKMLAKRQFLSQRDLGKTRAQIETWAAEAAETHIPKEERSS